MNNDPFNTKALNNTRALLQLALARERKNLARISKLESALKEIRLIDHTQKRFSIIEDALKPDNG